MKANLRQSQALFPFGVGAIIDVQGQSFVACDTTRWGRYEPVREQRLEKHLQVKEFRAPPVTRKRTDETGAPFIRFPRWLFCSSPACRRMHLFKGAEEVGDRPKCRHCGHELTPMRFVMACENGHLRDVPWDWWAHHASPDIRCDDRHRLRFAVRTDISDGSLASLMVECLACGSKCSLDQITRLQLPCDGRYPWLRQGEEDQCVAKSVTLQRGASNIRYDFAIEAIDIPPFADFNFWGAPAQRVRQHPLFNELVRISNPGDPWFDMSIDKVALDLGLETSIVEKVVAREASDGKGEVEKSARPIDFEEYVALTAPDKEHDPRDRFQKRTVDLDAFLSTIPPNDLNYAAYHEIRSLLKTVVLVTRLRCVRVLRGFSRITRDPDRMVPADLGRGDGTWLPAIEVFGEGVFVELDIGQLTKWAESASTKTKVIPERFTALPTGIQNSFSGLRPLDPGPQFQVLHTLTHLLMLQMQYSSGYSASSVRERIYFGERDDRKEEMSGILIFTSAGDVEGSMGGLVRLGQPENLFPLLLDAARSSITCSSDPVCAESPGQGLDGLNLAACHACALVPETSCSYRNQLLDRSVLCGSERRGMVGFLKRVVDLVDR